MTDNSETRKRKSAIEAREVEIESLRFDKGDLIVALAERDATIAAVRALADEWDAACRHDRANQAVACFDCLARSRRLRRILSAVDAGEVGE